MYINGRFIAVASQSVILTDVSAIGIDQILNENSSMIVYPNPTSEFFSINYDNLTNLNITINVFDLNGVLVKSELFKENQQKVNIENLSNGTYIVEIKSIEFSVKNKLSIKR